MKTHNNYKRSRAGFTLIELLAVILIIGILMTFLVPRILGAVEQANVTACKANMKEIFSGMMEYKAKYGHAINNDGKNGINRSGVRFFGCLVREEIFESVESDVKRLTCPGVEYHPVQNDYDIEEWFTRENWGNVTGDFSSYAGRDVNNYRLRKFPGSGTEALVADDNDDGMNHKTTTVVLWANGSVTTYELVELKDEGLIDPEETILIVGPDSPVDALQKLSLD